MRNGKKEQKERNIYTKQIYLNTIEKLNKHLFKRFNHIVYVYLGEWHSIYASSLMNFTLHYNTIEIGYLFTITLFFKVKWIFINNCQLLHFFVCFVNHIFITIIVPYITITTFYINKIVEDECTQNILFLCYLICLMYTYIQIRTNPVLIQLFIILKPYICCPFRMKMKKYQIRKELYRAKMFCFCCHVNVTMKWEKEGIQLAVTN